MLQGSQFLQLDFSVLFELLPMAHGLRDLVFRSKAIYVVVRGPEESAEVMRILQLSLNALHVLIQRLDKVVSILIFELEVFCEILHVSWVDSPLVIINFPVLGFFGIAGMITPSKQFFFFISDHWKSGLLGASKLVELGLFGIADFEFCPQLATSIPLGFAFQELMPPLSDKVNHLIAANVFLIKLHPSNCFLRSW